jgi:hypothetical protein
MQTANKLIVDCFRAGKFEKAIRSAENGEMTLFESEINSILDHFRKELQQALQMRSGSGAVVRISAPATKNSPQGSWRAFSRKKE